MVFPLIFAALAAMPAAAASSLSPFGWGQAVLVEQDNTGGAATPDVGVDARGNAVVVWLQWDGTRASAFASRFDVDRGWGVPTRVELNNAGDVASVRVAVDPGGNATAVGHIFTGSKFRIFANGFVPGVGWGTETFVDNASLGDAAWPQVAADANGNAIAAFRQNDVGTTSMIANRYVAGIGWGTPTAIEAESLGSDDVRIAMNVAGDAVAVWRQWEGSQNGIFANRYTVGVGWGTAAAIESTSNESIEPDVAMDDNGNAIVAWRQADGFVRNLYANRYDSSSGWGAPALLETDDSGDVSSGPQVAMSPGGDGIAVWAQSNGTTDNVWARRYAPGTGWNSPVLLESGTGQALAPRAAMDAEGNAFVVWLQSDGTRLNLWASRYRVGLGWTPAELIETDNQAGTSLAEIAADPRGNAVATWSQSDGTRFNVWANRYVRDNEPPTLILSLPSASLTNNPSVTVFGITEPGATATVDGVPVAVNSAGAFIRTVTLPDGPHTFVVVATDSEGNANTATWTIRVDTTTPALSLTSPVNNANVNISTVTVSGTTEAGATVVVNGIILDVASDGSFSSELALSEGANVITATATDAAGNTASTTRTVTYTNPVPGLESQIQSLLSDLRNTRQELNVTKVDLTRTQFDLETTNAALVGTQEALNSANAALASMAGLVQLFSVLVATLVIVVVVQFIVYWRLRMKLLPKP